MRFDVLTLHPLMVEGPLSTSIIGRARQSGVLDVRVHDIREQATDRHRSVDDTPYGGGAGMVMRVDIVAAALKALQADGARVLLTSPAGKPLQQADCQRWAGCERIVIITGHYEGIDARIETLIDEEVSLGDFVLTGGEIAAVAIVDAVGRLVPGVVGNQDSVIEESFADGLLEHPHYTRPAEWEGIGIPAVLVSGHHAKIAAWRRDQSLERTRLRRPDLYARYLESVDGNDSQD